MQKPRLRNGFIRSMAFGAVVSLPACPSAAQDLAGGLRPPLPEGSDWFAALEHALPHRPGSDAMGTVGDRIERFIAAPPEGQELVLLRTEYAGQFVTELASLRSSARILESWRDSEQGFNREILELPDGRIRAIDSWMSPPSFIRMAVATARSRDDALVLLARVAALRNRGGFGGLPLLHSPLVTP